MTKTQEQLEEVIQQNALDIMNMQAEIASLQAEIDALRADLAVNYCTRAEMDADVSYVETQLQTQINKISGEITCANYSAWIDPEDQQ